MNIRDKILKENLLDPEPYVYPMSAIRDEEIFRKIMESCVGKSKTIVETGTYVGLSSLLLSEYCDIIHTFDIKDYKEKYSIWEYFGVNTGDNKLNIEFHHIKNNIEKEEIVNNINQIDFCFVDGHHKNGCNIDFDMLRPHCKKFLFHDYCPEKCCGGEGLYDWMKKYLDSLIPKAKLVHTNSPFIYMEFD